MSELVVKMKETDIAALQKMFKGFDGLPRLVMARVYNDVIKGTKVDMSDGIRQVLNAKKKYVDRLIKINLASTRTDEVYGSVKLNEGELPIGAFGPVMTMHGVLVRFYTQGVGTVFPRAFMATMKSGYVGAFQRKTLGNPQFRPIRKSWKTMPTKYRLPIEKKFAPRATTVLLSNPVFDPLKAKISARLEKNMVREVNFAFIQIDRGDYP